MKNRARMAVVVWLVCFSAAAAVFADQWVSNVGIREFSVDFPPTHSKIKGLLWYPTQNRSETIKLGPFEVDVAKNAAIKTGKYGLIVISHGSRGSHAGHRDTAIYLAKRGYLVVSPLHPKNNYLDDSAGRTVENWMNRPRHISTILDWMLAASEYTDFIDSNKIGIVGFSAGGYTALALAGGVPDTTNITLHCSDHKKEDVQFYGAPVLYYKFKKMFSSQNVLNNLHDPRIKAVVLLAPLGIVFNDAQSLSGVTVPIRIYRAEKDDVLHYPYHAELIRQRLPVKPEYVVVKNAGHYSFLSPFTESFKQNGGVVTKDPKGFDRENFHTLLNQEIFEFLSTSLQAISK